MAGMIWIAVTAIFLLILVGLSVLLRLAERRWPALTRWLDEHAGEEPEWRKW